MLSRRPWETASAIAQRLAGRARDKPGERVERAKVAGPGFVNLFLSDSWHRRGVSAVLETERFGESSPASPAILLEFESSKPDRAADRGGGSRSRIRRFPRPRPWTRAGH